MSRTRVILAAEPGPAGSDNRGSTYHGRVARPEIDEIVLGGEAAAWEALGFAVCDGVIALGGVRLRLAGGGGRGIVGWSLRGLPPEGVDLDGLEAGLSDAEVVADGAEGAEGAACEVAHPLGAVAIDHLVALTPDFDRTLGKLR
ncbi:MAG: hypothetical protein QOF55_1120, partial [Thermoleophilaceae bacterium]|nr:hypothetical protein [Thermoleophilaceae bacterium]